MARCRGPAGLTEDMRKPSRKKIDRRITVLDGEEDYIETSVNLPAIYILMPTSPVENSAKVTTKYFDGSNALPSPTR